MKKIDGVSIWIWIVGAAVACLAVVAFVQVVESKCSNSAGDSLRKAGKSQAKLPVEDAVSDDDSDYQAMEKALETVEKKARSCFDLGQKLIQCDYQEMKAKSDLEKATRAGEVSIKTIAFTDAKNSKKQAETAYDLAFNNLIRHEADLNLEHSFHRQIHTAILQGRSTVTRLGLVDSEYVAVGKLADILGETDGASRTNVLKKGSDLHDQYLHYAFSLKFDDLFTPSQ